jgi:hypothetical protein
VGKSEGFEDRGEVFQIWSGTDRKGGEVEGDDDLVRFLLRHSGRIESSDFDAFEGRTTPQNVLERMKICSPFRSSWTPIAVHVNVGELLPWKYH